MWVKNQVLSIRKKVDFVLLIKTIQKYWNRQSSSFSSCCPQILRTLLVFLHILQNCVKTKGEKTDKSANFKVNFNAQLRLSSWKSSSNWYLLIFCLTPSLKRRTGASRQKTLQTVDDAWIFEAYFHLFY